MVSQSGRYYGDPLTGTRGVMQIDPLPPTILIMVVEAVIQNFSTVPVGKSEVAEVFERAVQNLYTFFYMDDGLLYSPWKARLHTALNVLTGLLKHVGIQTNVINTVGMTWQPCCTSRSLLEVDYTWRMIGVGPSYWDRQQEKNQPPYCRAYLASRSLYNHH